MKIAKPILRSFLSDESGQDLIEYALVAALIGLTCVAALQTIATSITSAYGSISTSVTGAV